MPSRLDQTMRILLIEDDPDDALVVMDMLDRLGQARDRCTHRSRLAQGLAYLQSSPDPPGVVLLDLSLPDAEGLAGIARLQELGLSWPLIVLTGQADERTASAAIERGAQDYLVKGRFDADLLARSIRYGVERQRQCEELKRLNAVKDEFLTIASHEIRAPVSTIWSICELILMGSVGEVAPDAKLWVERMMAISSRTTELVEGLLRHEVIEQGILRPKWHYLSPLPALQRCLENAQPSAASAGIRLQGDFPRSLPRFWHAPVFFDDIFINLLGNALKFTEPGGVIEMRAVGSASTLEVVVRNSGRPIPTAELQRIFEPRRDPRAARAGSKNGFGLGLAICKRLVDLHGGRILVESSAALGTSLTVVFPLGKPRLARAEQQALEQVA